MVSVIKLDNGLEFIVLAQLELDSEKYCYLSSKNEELKFISARWHKNGYLEPVEDGDIISKLI